MEFMLGGIIQFGGNFAPRGWSFCRGQMVSISQNQALFAILGTSYGGDGRTTFCLPDLQGRTPIGFGTGVGLTPINIGNKCGVESVSLQVAQMPAHTHNGNFSPTTASGKGLTANTTTTMKVTSEKGGTNDPSGAYLAMGMDGRNGVNIYKKNLENESELNSAAIISTTTVTGSCGGITGGSVGIGSTGGGARFSIIQPSLGMNFIIAIQGMFPSRN